MDSNAPVEPRNGKNGNSDGTLGSDGVKQAVPPPHTDRIAKNTSYLTAALVIQKVVSLVYFVYISRAVGPHNVGSYLAAIAVTTVLGFFIDLNFSQALIRETAKHPEKTNDFLNASLSVKCVTAIFAYAVAQLYVHLFHLSPLVQSLVLLTGGIMVLDSLTLSLYSIFRGHQKLQYESIGTIVNKVIVTTFGVIGLKLGYGVRLLVLAILVGSAFNLLYSGILVARKLNWRFRFVGISEDVKYLARIVLPWFALGGVFVTIYGYVDQLLLTNPLLVGHRGEIYLSWYGTAYKLTFAFQFIPAAVVAAIFPAMSAYFISNRAMLAKTFERAFYYLMVIVAPLTAGILILARPIILAAYGRTFAASILPLQILIIGLVFVFLNYPVGYLLNAADRQRRNTIHVGIVMVFNIILNLFLIPKYTFVGASIASTISSVFLFTLGMLVARRIVALNQRFLLLSMGKIIISSGAMVALLFLLKTHVHLLTLLPIAVICYFGVLFLVRGFKKSDGVKIYHSLVRKVADRHDGEA